MRTMGLVASWTRHAKERAPRRGLLGHMLRPLFSRVLIDAEADERLRSAHADGLVVHVMRSRRLIDPLFLLDALYRRNLPRPEWLHDHRSSPAPATEEALLGTLQQGSSALLFLRRPRTLSTTRTSYDQGFVEGLVELQRTLSRPILLLPETLFWRRRAATLRRTLIDVIFGDAEGPGTLRELIGFLLRADSARLHVGVPVNLQTFLEREKTTPTAVVAKKIRWSILNHLARESAIRLGPVQRPVERTWQLVLNDPVVKRQLAPAPDARESKSSANKQGRAEHIVKHLAADMRYGWLRVLDVIASHVWRGLFDGIVVDDDGLNNVWGAVRKGPLVLVPSHKSHADYLVLSHLFYRRGMIPPHVAAGENLSFWPLGTMFRRAGAFFIRRSLGVDKLYAAICAAYVRRLLRDGVTVEFFIEGGRSRSGKLLEPKTGVLAMCIDPVLDGDLPDLSFVPVSISYDKIIEAESYQRELAGEAKAKENVGALLSTRKVLRWRYGRVYVDFHEPLSLCAFAAARGFSIRNAKATGDEAPHVHRDRRALVDELANEIIYAINRVTRVTPTGIAALVLLTHTTPSMDEITLDRRAGQWIDLLGALSARMSVALDPNTRTSAIDEALSRFVTDGLLAMTTDEADVKTYQIDARGRRALDYYKNNIVHFLVPASVLSMALLHEPSAPVSIERVYQTTERLYQLLAHEFPVGAQSSVLPQTNAALDVLVARRILTKDTAQGLEVQPEGRARLVELASQIAVFFEAKHAVLAALPNEAMTEKHFQTYARLAIQNAAKKGLVTRPEAASSLTAQNAVRLLLGLGIVKRDRGKLLVQRDAREHMHALTAELASYLALLGASERQQSA